MRAVGAVSITASSSEKTPIRVSIIGFSDGLHRRCDAGLIRAIKRFGLTRGIQHRLLLIANGVFREHGEKHVAVLFIRLAVRAPVGEIVPRYAEVIHPALAHLVR